MSERILALALGMTGANETEQAVLTALCAAAEAAWMARLLDGVAAEDCAEAFCCAAAFTAAADFAVSRSGDSVASFTAGEISIKGKDSEESAGLAASMRQTAERLMAPYAEPEGFCFKGVQG